MASTVCSSGTSGIIEWLATEWPLLIESVIEECIEQVGKVSGDEAKKALFYTGGNVMKASKLCIQDRQCKV